MNVVEWKDVTDPEEVGAVFSKGLTVETVTLNPYGGVRSILCIDGEGWRVQFSSISIEREKQA